MPPSPLLLLLPLLLPLSLESEVFRANEPGWLPGGDASLLPPVLLLESEGFRANEPCWLPGEDVSLLHEDLKML